MALADEQIAKVTEIVTGKLSVVQSWAQSARTAAQTALDSVGVLAPPPVLIQFPDAPTIPEPLEPRALDIPEPRVNNNPQSVTFSGTESLSFEEPAEVPAPQYGVPVPVPSRPTDAPPSPPTQYPTASVGTAPVMPDISPPTAPVIGIPDPPDLVSISIPTLAMPSVDPFNAELPAYDSESSRMGGLVAKAETLIAETRTQLAAAATAFAAAQASKGGELTQDFLALNDDRKKRMRQQEDEAVAVIDREVMAKTKEARTLWAARNFSLVPGMLVDQVNEIEIEGGRKVREASSKINQAAMKLAKDEFDKVMNIYLTLEQNLIEYNLEVARRSLEEEKVRVRAQMELFNSVLAMYKAKQSAVGAHIEVFQAQKQFALQQIGAYKTAVDGAVAATAENEARARIYSSQVQASKVQADLFKSSMKAALAPIEAYKAQLIGVKAEADTAVANIESYRESVKGYAAAVDAATAEVRAYAAQVQAVGASTSVAETNARAYAEYIQQAVRGSTVYKTFIAEQSEVMSAYMQTFREASNANEGFVRAQAAKVSAETEMTSAKISAFDKYVRSFSSYNRAMAEKTSAVMAHSMTSAENAARAQALVNQAQSEADKITAGALAGKAQALAGLAQGAMSALHVSASAQGTGSTSSSYGYGKNVSASGGGSRTLSESRTESISA